MTIAAAPAADQTFRVNSRLDKVDANPGDGICKDSTGKCTLRAAITEANELGGHTLVKFASTAKHKLTIEGRDDDNNWSGDLDINGAHVTLQGRGVNIDAMHIDRAFDVRDGGLTLQNVTVVNGDAADSFFFPGPIICDLDNSTDLCAVPFDHEFFQADGGAVRAHTSDVLIRDSRFFNNTASGAGGAVSVSGEDDWGDFLNAEWVEGQPWLPFTPSFLDVSNSVFEGNTAYESGGGIATTNAGALVTGSTISDNMSYGVGGGFSAMGMTPVELRDVDVERNTATFAGGGIMGFAPVMLADVEVRDNAVTSDEGRVIVADHDLEFAAGGGVAVFGMLEVVQSTIHGNSAGGGAGGGVGVIELGWGRFGQSTITDNHAGIGGGIAQLGGLDIYDSVISNNEATEIGGGIFAIPFGGLGNGPVPLDHDEDYAFPMIKQTTISGNSATSGGGIAVLFGELGLSHVNIHDNVADFEGGGVFNDGGYMWMQNSIIQNNSTAGSGGGIMNWGFFKISDSLIKGNTAAGGGGVYNDGDLFLSGGDVIQNTAANAGGGVFNDGFLSVDGTTISGNFAPFGADVQD